MDMTSALESVRDRVRYRGYSKLRTRTALGPTVGLVLRGMYFNYQPFEKLHPFLLHKRSDLYHEICIFPTQKLAGNNDFFTLIDSHLYYTNSRLNRFSFEKVD